MLCVIELAHIKNGADSKRLRTSHYSVVADHCEQIMRYCRVVVHSFGDFYFGSYAIKPKVDF